MYARVSLGISLFTISFLIMFSGCLSEEEPPIPQDRDIKTCLYYFGEGLNNNTAYRTASNYDLLILNEVNGNPSNIQRIKSRNPDAKILLYTMAMDLPNANHYVFANNPDIHPSLQELYLDIDANYPEYFLLDSQGDKCYLSAYAQLYEDILGYCMDTRTGWSDYYVGYVASWMELGIYDGIYSDAAKCYGEMNDEVNTMDWETPGNEYLWDTAVKNMLEKIENGIRPELMTMYNNGYNKWIGVYDARFIEWWIQYGEEPLGGPQWVSFIQSGKESLDTGKSLCVAQYGYGDQQRMYGLTSFLLIANDNAYYYFNDGGSVDVVRPLEWYPEYELSIGDPIDPYYVTDGVYVRKYTNATIVVNPTNTIKNFGGYSINPLSGEILPGNS